MAGLKSVTAAFQLHKMINNPWTTQTTTEVWGLGAEEEVMGNEEGEIKQKKKSESHVRRWLEIVERDRLREEEIKG